MKRPSRVVAPSRSCSAADSRNHGVVEDYRVESRTAQAVQSAAQHKSPLASLLIEARRTTQRSVKFVRWLRQSLRDQLAETAAGLHLRLLYASL